MDFFSELVDGDVGGGTHEDLSRVHFGEVIDDGGGGDCFAGTGGSLDQAKGFLENTFDSKDLTHVQLGEIWCRHSKISGMCD